MACERDKDDRGDWGDLADASPLSSLSSLSPLSPLSSQSPITLLGAHLNFAADESVLSADERARADALRVPRERRRFVAAHALARQVLAEQLGIAPREVTFAFGSHGKPHVIPPSHREGPGVGLYFNVSRSEDDWVCAISRKGEIGVDVEALRDLPELEAMIRAYCTKREQLALRALVSARSALVRDFLVCWTRKEAALKAIGAGLSIPPNEIEVFSEAEETEVVAQGRRWGARTQVLPSLSGSGEVVVSVAHDVTAHAPSPPAHRRVARPAK